MVDRARTDVLDVEAQDIRKGDILIGGGYSEREVTRVNVRATSVTVLLDGLHVHTFRNFHEIVTVRRLK
jgi:hypothetical protein